VALVCLVLAAAAGLAFPAVVRWLLDAAFVARDRALLDRMALGLLAVFAVQGVCNYVQVLLLTARRSAWWAGAARAACSRTSCGCRRRSSPSGARRADEPPRGDLTLLQQLMNTWISEFARQVLFLVGGAVLLTQTDPHLTLTTLAVAPVVVAVAVVCGPHAAPGERRRAGPRGRVGRARRRGVLADPHRAELRARGRGDAALRRAARRRGARGARARAGARGVLRRGRLRGVRRRGGGALAGRAARARRHAHRRRAGVVLFYAFFIAAAVGSLASLFGNFQEAVGAAERVFELLDLEPTVAEPARPAALPRPAHGRPLGAVAFDDVTFRYGPDLPDVLHGVTLRAAPGEVVAIVGRSGAGKTTLASLLPRFWDATGGRVLLDGVDVRDLALATCAARWAWCRRSRRCSAARCATTWPTRAPARRTPRSRRRRGRRTRTSSSSGCRRGTPRRWASAA
jgi:ABC-type multidrug transport system fused ATPase/permease subunit